MTRPDPCPQPLCILDIPDPSACDDCPNEPMPENPSRGGKRAGAGAPVGNLNRLVHGQRSKQVEAAIDKLASDPELRPLLRFFSVLSAKQHGYPIRLKERS